MGSRLLLLFGSMAAAAALILIWSSAVEIVSGERVDREFAQQSRALAAARAARDNLPRALEPAERALSALQNRALALGRNDRRDAEAVEQTLLAQARRSQDGLRAVAVTDVSGTVTWQSQPGAVPAWLGGNEVFQAHRYGRQATMASRPAGAAGNGLMLSAPILAAGGGFAGVAVAVLDSQRMAQFLPGAAARGDPQLLLFHSDGTLLARGRNAVVGGPAPRLDAALMPEAGGAGERGIIRPDAETGRSLALASAVVQGFDLIVLASIEEPPGGLGARRMALMVYGLAGAVSCLVGLALVWLFGRSLRQTDAMPAEDEEEDPYAAEEATPLHSAVIRPVQSPPPARPGPPPVIATIPMHLPAPAAATQAPPPPAQAYQPAPALAPPQPPQVPPSGAPLGPFGFIEALPTVAYAARITPAGPGVDRHIRITAVNSTLLQLTGWEASAFQDVSKWQRAIDWGSYPPGAPLLERLAEPTAAGEKPCEEGQVEYRLRRPDGSWMWLRETAKVVNRYPTHVDVLGCLGDVTRERELAAQADNASRVAARGAMAAGLAHELNQPLAVMSLAAENALEALEEGVAGIPEALARLRRISAQAERAKAIAAQLRSFARLEAAVLEPVSLPAAIRGALSLAGGALAEAGINVEIRMDPALPAVRGQPVLVEQVVVNLCLNARDAMVSRGEGPRLLTILGEPGIETHEVRLVVADTGGGIPPEALERVFDPFFSTKPASKGTGLGLPLCRSIMLRFGGSISLTNVPNGTGAQAVLTFQRARQPQGERVDVAPLVQGI